MHEQEAEADQWAASWAPGDAPTAMHREFRALANAVALCWIGLTNIVHRTDATHPHPSELLGKLFMLFELPDESPALEIAAYMTKAFFDPYTEIPAVEDVTDAFLNVLIGCSRLPR